MIRNILLVDTSVQDHEVFLRSVNEKTKAIPYSSTTTYDEIRAAIPGPVNQLGIVFVKGALFLGRPFTEQYDFFASLVQQFELKHLDFLGCETLPAWESFYARFTNVIIGASNNRTGNIQYGGDWTMESTMEDVEGVYFTNSIQYYKYLLDSIASILVFVKGDGLLYGMGDNNSYQLGLNSNTTLPAFTPVKYNGSNITGVTKIQCRDDVTNTGASMIQVGNKLYGVGFDYANIYGQGQRIYNTFTEATLPSTGPVQDFAIGFNTIFIVQNNRFYSRGVNVGRDEAAMIYSYKHTLLDPEVDDFVTNVHCGNEAGIVVLAKNKIYYRNAAANYPWVNIPIPADVTGPVQKIMCQGADQVFLIIGGKFYVAVNMHLPTKIFQEGTFGLGLINQNVTDMAFARTKSWFVVNNQLYGAGFNEYGELGTGYGWGPFIIPFPAGVTGTIVGISSKTQTSLTVNIYNGTKNVLYGIGNNEFSQIGGSNISEKRTLTEIAIDSSYSDASVFDMGYQYSFAVIGGVLHGIGRNSDNQLGIPLLNRIYPAIPIQIDGSYVTGVTTNTVAMVSNGQYSNYRFSCIGMGDDLYASGMNDQNRAGLGISVPSSTTFKKIALPPESSGKVTFVSATYESIFFVKGNKIYKTNAPTRSIIELPLPAGATGRIVGLKAGWYSSAIVILENGNAYGIGSNYEWELGFTVDIRPTAGSYGAFDDRIHPINSFQQLKLGSGYITNVTAASIGMWCSLIISNNEAYYSGMIAPNATWSKGYTKVTFPPGVTGPVEYIACSAGYSVAVVGGILYAFAGNATIGGMGNVIPSNSLSLNAFEVKSLGNTVTGVTGVSCLDSTTVVTQGTKLSWMGNPPPGSPEVYGSALITVTNDLMGVRMTIASSSTYNGLNYGSDGTTFHIVGELLSKVASIQFGLSPITTFIEQTSALLRFAVPNASVADPSGVGTIVPVVTDNDGKTYTLAPFYYSNPMTITSLSMYMGNTNQVIQVSGPSLTAVRSVQFGNTNTLSTVTVSPSLVSVTIPPRGTQPKKVKVSVKDQYGTSSNELEFTYAEIEIQKITNESDVVIDSAVGGTKIKIFGTNLMSASTVLFSTTPGLSMSKSNGVVTVTVPRVIGEMAIRVSDAQNNMVEFSTKIKCALSVEALKESPVKITYSTQVRYPSGTTVRHYAMDNKTIQVENGTGFRQVAGNANNIILNDIKGIASYPSPTSVSLFIGDATLRKIHMFNALDPSYAMTEYFTDNKMSPVALKVFSIYLFVVCSNGAPTDYALLKINILTKVIEFSVTNAQFANYQLRNILITPSYLYVSAVPYNGAEYNISEGRVIRLNPTGTIENVNYITSINNPKDMAIYNGYLVVDGNLQFYTPSGELVTRFVTEASTITVEEDTAYFTSDVGVRSVLNKIVVEPYRNEAVLTVNEATPTSGPRGTLVFISGTSMRNNILGITVNGSNFTDYWLNDLVLTLRMPDASGVVPIVVTYTGGSKTYSFTYASSNITQVIPLYGTTKKYHFTGNNLRNIVYVDFVSTQVSQVTNAKRLVYNNTDTSFDCDFVELPVNSTRILMQDAYGVTTIEDANMFTLSSETCFLGGTPVLTDQGEVPIDKIDPTLHTLRQKEILAITKIRYNGNALVLLEKDSLRPKYPKRDTVISRKHKIYYKGKMKTAESLVGHAGVQLVPYRGQFLYNVLLKTHEKMSVNGLICETLHPKNPIVKYFI